MKIIVLIVTVVCTVTSGSSQIRLPLIFGDHMVLQRNQPVPVWGWSSPNEKLVVKFNKQIRETVADKSGKWRINLDPEPAGGPFDISVQGKNTVVYHDVMVGEVWLCSGQSNMEFELSSVRNAESEIMAANFPEIRQIKVPHAVSTSLKEDIQATTWELCSSKTAADFTAVGYFFAREMVKHLHVAVGLINSTWGGTMSEAWTSHGALEKSPEFRSVIASVPEKDIESLVRERRQRLDQQISSIQKDIKDSVPETEWKNPEYSVQAWPKMSVAKSWENQPLGLKDLDGTVWFRKEIMLDARAVETPIVVSLGKIDDFDETYVNGVLIGSTKNYEQNRVYHAAPGIFKEGKNVIAVRVEDTGGDGGFYGDSSLVNLKTADGMISLSNYWSFRIAKVAGNSGGLDPNDYPALLFNAMIYPLIPYSIRGVLWYQGEANANRAYQYRSAFPLMINDWRQHWSQGNFPFYFVQLASFNAGNGDSQHGSTWAELREAQTHTLSLPATGMAVTTDIGESNDIHPKNKQDVGMRLAAIALNNIYGQTMEYSGPVYESMNIQDNKIVLSFSHTGSGLIARNKYGYLMGFEVAGSDHHFHYAKALVENNKVIVYSDEVIVPESVHYAWADDAGDANLYNQQGFPAVPFRTDQWKGITDEKKFVIGK